MRAGKWRYPDWLLLAFTAGIVAGTAAVRLFGGNLIREQLEGVTYAAGPPTWEFYIKVLMRRLFQITAGWIIGMTICSVPLLCLAAAWAGVSQAVVLSVLTAQKGLMGLPLFLCSLLPHCLIYGVVWWILASWAGGEEKRVRLVPFMVLAALTALGAASEAVISPLLTRLF